MDQFFCNICKIYVGTLNEVMEGDACEKHYCFRNASNINVDIETHLIGIDQKEQVELDVQAFIGETSRDTEQLSPGAGQSAIEKTSKPAPVKSQGFVYDSNSSSEQIEVEQRPPSWNVAPENENTKYNFWSEAETKLLITTYEQHMSKFDSPMFNVQGVFKRIAEDLGKENVIKSSKSCEVKWRNLKKTYEEVMKKNKKTGTPKTRFKYFEMMHNILFKSVKINPVCTVSQHEIKTRVLTDNENKDIRIEKTKTVTDRPDAVETVFPKKKKKKSEEEETREQARERRHRERITQKNEMFKWFQDNFPKNN